MQPLKMKKKKVYFGRFHKNVQLPLFYDQIVFTIFRAENKKVIFDPLPPFCDPDQKTIMTRTFFNAL